MRSLRPNNVHYQATKRCIAERSLYTTEAELLQ